MAQWDIIVSQNVAASGKEYVSRSVNIPKGGLLTADGSYLPQVVSPGTNGYVLVADSSDPNGIKWDDISNVLPSVLPVSKGGTGRSSITANAIISGNGTSAVGIESSILVQTSKMTIGDSSAPSVKLTFNAIGSDDDHASIYNYKDAVGYRNLVLGSDVPAEGILVDKINNRIGIFNSAPDYKFHVTADVGVTGDLYFATGATRKLLIDGPGGNNLVVQAGGSTSNGGDLYLSQGGGVTQGNVHLGSNEIGLLASNVYVKTIKSSGSSSFVAIDGNGKLSNKLVPVVSSTQLLTISSSGVVGSSATAPVGSVIQEIDDSSTTVLSNSTGPALGYTYSISHADYIDSPNKNLWEIKLFGYRSGPAAVGKRSMYIIVKKGTTTLETIEIEVQGRIISRTDQYVCTVYIYPTSSTLTTLTYDAGFNADNDYTEYGDRKTFSASGISHGTGNDIKIYFQDESSTNNSIQLYYVMVQKKMLE
jgi:hypothetical protein